ncbi:MAG: sterol desaturase family protein [Proteobacteria bacterium]|nr:sterol desaturase family protein [Pseudomonadota bacterium]
MLRAALRYGMFPVVFGGALTAGAVLVHRMPPGQAVALLTVAAVGIIVVLERIQPKHASWNEPKDDLGTDLVLTFVGTTGPPELMKALFLGGLTAVGASISEAVGFPLWPSAWPLAAQVLLALVVAELGQYIVHRAAHETDLLWRLHSIHHSAERLYWLNAGRFHPLDTAAQYTLAGLPLMLLGIPEETLALFLLFTGVHGLFQHANLDLKLGPLNWFFSMAELHRWHHSRTIDESNSNYGANLIVWDIVFGTRFLPADREPPEAIGIADMPNFPRRWWEQLLVPFRWKHTKDASGPP